tara:strand:+ start:507 stop:968 length:462 start_codon:yes stop_codon:yes gene_type:complete
MKQIMTFTCAALMAATMMTGCTPGNNTGGATMTGAALGGLLGGAVTGGDDKWAGALAGALIGGALGNQIGKHMDAQDQKNMQSAITTTPVGSQAQWTNQQTDTTYKVTPTKQYTSSSNQYCREYTTTVTVEGKTQTAYGRACKQSNGQWKVVS